MLYTNQYLCQNILAIKGLRPFVFVFGFNAFSAILIIVCHLRHVLMVTHFKWSAWEQQEISIWSLFPDRSHYLSSNTKLLKISFSGFVETTILK